MLLATPAVAGDLSQKRILPENSFFAPNSDGVPYLYGQLNKGILVHSDGNGTNTFAGVDNSNSPSRAGIRYEEKWWPNVSVMANVEIGWTPYSSFSVSQSNKNRIRWGAASVRKVEVSFDVEDYGRLWIGQGSMASDGSAEQDLSGTSVVAYSSVADIAGGQFFAFDPTSGLSMVRLGNAFVNFDGLGRKMRLRYDSPSFFGVKLSSSLGYNALSGDNEAEWDIAATYKRDEADEDFAVSAAAAFSRAARSEARVSGSFSALHKPTALSLTLAGGYDERKFNTRTPAYFYGKLGYAPTLTSLGPTAFAVDVYAGEGLAVNGSDSLSFGLAAVQTFVFKDGSIDLYGVVRQYAFDDPTANYKNGLTFFTGARWSF